MPIGTGIVYNAGDLILSQVSGSGTAFLETKIAAATSSIIYFDNTARINSASLSSLTIGTASYVSGSTSIITNLTASNISASSITGSLFGSSSWSNNSVSSSYALTSSVATNETLGTVTGRGASTGTQITVATAAGGTMYTGRKAGAGYADGVSGATFKSITDNPNGASYAFASYYSGSTGFNSFYVSALGDGYFSGSVGIGTTSPAYKLDVSGSSRFGYQSSDTHQFTGSVSISGSLNATASWANNVVSASYATTANALSSMNISQFTNNSKYHYHRTDISSLSSSATNLVQPLSTFDYNNATNGPGAAWYNYFSSTHGDYLTSLIANQHRTANWYVAYREGSAGTPTNPVWYALLHEGNYTTYTVTKTGTGASGTWSITSSIANALNTANNYTVGSLTSTTQLGGSSGTLVSYVTPGVYATGTSTGNAIGIISNTTFANNGAIANIGLNQSSSNANDITAKVHMTIGGWYQNSGTGIPIYLGNGYTIESSPTMVIAPADANGGGNVGIGTTNPIAKLHVVGNISGSSFTSSISNAVGFLGTSSWAQTANALNTGNSYTIAGLTNNGTLSQQNTLSMGSGYQILATTGTAPIPGIAFVGNTNTGIYSPSSNIIGFSISGSEKVRIDSSGNLLIGTTTSPSNAGLSVGSTGTVSQILGGMQNTSWRIREKSAIDWCAWTTNINDAGTQDDATKSSWLTQQGFGNGNDAWRLGRYPAGSSTLNTFIYVNSSGNVGIGTSSPAQKLEVQSGSIQIRGDGNALFGTYYASAGENTFFTIHSGSGNTFHIGNDVAGTYYNTMVFTAATDSTGGKVGIGTSSPGSKLQVNDSNPTLTLRANDGGTSRKAYIDFYTTFYNYPSDVGARRTSTIVTGFADGTYGTWGTEFLAFNVGSGSANDSALLPIERVRIDGSGNLGVGTSTVIGKLQVNSTAAPYYGPATSSANANGIFILGNTTTDVVNTFGVDATSTAYAWIQPRKSSAATYYSLVLNPNGGNVGVGTTSPVATLQVNGNISGSSFTSSISNAVGFLGTSSWASNVVSASYATTAQTANALNTSNNYQVNSIGVNIAGSGTAGKIGTNELGVRSWSITPTGGRLLFESGDGNGSAYFVFPVSASTFVGAGTGLTGTAASLTAGTANALNAANSYTVASLTSGYVDVTGTTIPTTGIYRPSTKTLGLSADSTLIFKISNVAAPATSSIETGNFLVQSGNVGIGTTNPTDKLTVYGALASYKDGANTIQTQVYLANAGNTRAFNIQLNSGGTGLDLWSYNSSNAWLRHTTFDYDGKVGIGTAAPAAKFEISGSSNSALMNIKSPISGAILYVSGSGAVGIGTSNVGAYTLQVNGSFGATTKSFIIDHPTKEGKKLIYGSLESPYHGIRLTGRDTLKEGKCKIQLPDYIYKLILHDSVNIQLTGIKCNKTLYVDDINIPENYFTIAYDKALFESYKDYDFFWDFTAIRADVPELITEL